MSLEQRLNHSFAVRSTLFYNFSQLSAKNRTSKPIKRWSTKAGNVSGQYIKIMRQKQEQSKPGLKRIKQNSQTSLKSSNSFRELQRQRMEIKTLININLSENHKKCRWIQNKDFCRLCIIQNLAPACRWLLSFFMYYLHVPLPLLIHTMYQYIFFHFI